MKDIDIFGNPIFPHIYQKMKDYARKLIEIGFREALDKPNLFYWKNENVIVFADMRGYKDSWGRFIPIWDKTREGKPRFYQEILNYEKRKIGKINKMLWNLFLEIKNKGIQFIIIDPFDEVPSSWSANLISAPRFFLNHSQLPLVVDDDLDPSIFFSGICLECGCDIDQKDMFCLSCIPNIPSNLFSNINYLMKNYYFNYNPGHNVVSIPLSNESKRFETLVRKEKFKTKFFRAKDNICRLCGEITNDIIKHHVFYKPTKILRVCRLCHAAIHHSTFPNPYWNQKRTKKEPRKKLKECPFCGKNHQDKTIAKKHRIFHIIVAANLREHNLLSKHRSARNIKNLKRLNDKCIKIEQKIREFMNLLEDNDKNKIFKILDENRKNNKIENSKERTYRDIKEFI
ncbi:MAG: hypothetical protein P8Y97_20135 [Candidatus Lokiarchaeota archaeon]